MSYTELTRAGEDGDKNKVAALLALGIDVNQRDEWGWTALGRSADRGRIDVVAFLIRHGADINAKCNGDNTPLIWAAYCGRKNVVEMLLDAGSNINDANNDGDTALHCALRRGHPQIGSLLIERGADVMVANKINETPLDIANQKGQSEMVKSMLSAMKTERVFNAKDKDGKTGLHRAVKNEKGLERAKSLLRKKGIDVNAKDKDGRTPLHIATENNAYKCVKLLLGSQGVNVNAKDGKGRTPLHLAAEKDSSGVVPLLLRAGADANLRDDEGKSALDIARMKSHRDVMDELEAFESQCSIANQLKEVKGRLGRREGEMEELKKQVDESECEKEELKKQLHQSVREKEELKDQVYQMERDIEIEKMKRTLIEESEKSQANLEKRLEELEKQQKEERQEMAEMKRQAEETREQIGSVTQMKSLFQEHTDAVNCQMKELREGVENDVKGRLDQLEKSEKMEELKHKITEVETDLRTLQTLLDNHFDQAEPRCTCSIFSIDSVASAIDAKPNNLKDGNLKKSNEEAELEMNEMEQEKLLNTIEIVGVEETSREYLPIVVQSLSLILGTPLYDAFFFYRTSKKSFQVQFVSVESAQSWLTAFKKYNQEILAHDLNPNLNEVPVSIEPKLTSYNRDIVDGLRQSPETNFWIEDGKIFAKRGSEDEVRRIKSIRDIPK